MKGRKQAIMRNCFLQILFIVFAIILLSSCSNDRTQDLQSTIDSLQQVSEQNEKNYLHLSEYLNIIASGIDSIAAQEESLFTTNTLSGESPALNKNQMKQNLMTFQDLIMRQRVRIDSLETALSKESGNMVQLQTIVASLKKQLNTKDAQIAQLQHDLDDKNKSINELKTNVNALTEQNNIQTEVLTAQDSILNVGYVKVATKKELVEAGLLSSGGFLRKKKISYDNINTEQMKAIDIRKVSEIEIPSKKPKILTAMPAGSYTIETGKHTSIIRITDVGRFWSVTNILIIQSDK